MIKKIEQRIEVICKNKKCRKSVKLWAKLEIVYRNDETFGDVYSISIGDTSVGVLCRHCGREVHLFGPTIGRQH